MYVPLFSVSSREFEEDLATLKEFFNSFEKKLKITHGYRFSSDAQLAMGWWFYDIFVQKNFLKEIIEYEHISNSKIRDEKGILKLIQSRLKQKGSKAKIKFHGEKPLFSWYWSWLMK